MLVLWFGWSLLLRGEYQRIRESGILEYQNRVTQRQTKQENLAQLQQLATHVDGLNQERLDQLNAILPTGFDSVAMIDQMQAFAAVAKVTILSIDVTQESSTSQSTTVKGKAAQTAETDTTSAAQRQLAQSNVRTAVITLNVESEQSSYADMKAFLDTLESFVPVLNLHNLTYSPETTSFALQLQTYYIDSTSQQ